MLDEIVNYELMLRLQSQARRRGQYKTQLIHKYSRKGMYNSKPFSDGKKRKI